MPNFRVLVSQKQIVGEILNRHIHFLSKRGDDWSVVGVMVLNTAEWERLWLICEITDIGVEDGPAVSTDAPKAAAAE